VRVCHGATMPANDEMGLASSQNAVVAASDCASGLRVGIDSTFGNQSPYDGKALEGKENPENYEQVARVKT